MLISVTLQFFFLQVKAFVNQVEQSAKHQLKSKPANSPWNDQKSATIDAKPRKSSSSSNRKSSKSSIENHQNLKSEISKSTTKSEIVSKSSSKPVTAPKMDEKLNLNSKTTNGSIMDLEPPIPQKPQFYFGQSMSDVVKKSSITNGNHQTAIDKVKKNEALTHPKRAEMEQNFAITELQKKGRHTSIITVSDDNSENLEKPPKKVNSQKASSMSSGVSSLSSSSSGSSSARSSPAKETSQVITKKLVERVEPTQDSIRKAFEAQLIAGKSRLKKTPAPPVGENEVGQVVKPPPAPIPPPPPPPSEEALRNGSLRSYEIPQAPKLKKTTPTLATKKGLVAPNGLSAREELMMAIRGTGGFQGLRKVSTISFVNA